MTTTSSDHSVPVKLVIGKPVKPEDMDLCDLYVVLQKPCTVRFQWKRTKVELKGVLSDDGSVSVCSGNTIFMSVDDWIACGTVARKPVSFANRECRNFTIKSESVDNS